MVGNRNIIRNEKYLIVLLFVITENSALQRKLARVLYDFNALANRELSVRKGDLVLINKPVNHNWVEVEDTYSGLIVCFDYINYKLSLLLMCVELC